MHADIEIRSVFTVKGRGAVAVGYLRGGTVRVGQRTPLPAPRAGAPRWLTLAAVEPVHSPDGGGDALGLVFRERPSIEELGAALTPGIVLRFEDFADGGDSPR
jgi:translation elongation factor EF-Tu-like GTPase